MSVCSSSDEIPDELVCPITQEIFQDPVMDRDGRTFERKAILMWLSNKGTCPLTRRPTKPSNYIPNVKMQSMVKIWHMQQDNSNSSSAADFLDGEAERRDKHDEERSNSLFVFDIPGDNHFNYFSGEERDEFVLEYRRRYPPQNPAAENRRRRRRFRFFR